MNKHWLFVNQNCNLTRQMDVPTLEFRAKRLNNLFRITQNRMKY